MLCERIRYKTILAAFVSGVIVFSILSFVVNNSERITWNDIQRIHMRSIFQQERSPTNVSSIPSTVKQLDACPDRPKDTAHLIKITTNMNRLTVTEDRSGNITPGGRYKPSTCISRHLVAVIVPYRDRETHLKLFLNHMHPFLQRQQLDYGIFVIESVHGIRFNRGLLMNVGFIEASKLYEYDCFIFHDVDLLPENDRINYTCDQSPMHLSNAIDSWRYRLPYPGNFGGVSAISKKHFNTINGFSNIYFGWGAEDDDLHEKVVKYRHLHISRPPSGFGRYKSLKHVKAKPSPERLLIQKTSKRRYRTDGLNSLKYHKVKQEFKPLYTWILVSVNETETLENEPIHKLAFRDRETNRLIGNARKYSRNNVYLHRRCGATDFVKCLDNMIRSMTKPVIA